MTTPVDLDDLEAKHAAATPGEWAASAQGMHAIVTTPFGSIIAETYSATTPIEDALAIAATHNALPALIAELRGWRSQDEEWRNSRLPEDADIATAHPAKTGGHALYAEALRLVTARRSKRGLVELVNWLLARTLSEPALCTTCGIVAVPGPTHASDCVRQQLANAACRREPCPWCRGPLTSDERFNQGPPVFAHHHSCPRSRE